MKHNTQPLTNPKRTYPPQASNCTALPKAQLCTPCMPKIQIKSPVPQLLLEGNSTKLSDMFHTAIRPSLDN